MSHCPVKHCGQHSCQVKRSWFPLISHCQYVYLLKELSHGWNRESYRVIGTPDFTTPDSHCQYVSLLKELSHGWNRESYQVTGTPDRVIGTPVSLELPTSPPLIPTVNMCTCLRSYPRLESGVVPCHWNSRLHHPWFPLSICIPVEGAIPRLESGVVPGYWNSRLHHPWFPLSICVFVEGAIPRLESGVVPGQWNSRLHHPWFPLSICVFVEGAIPRLESGVVPGQWNSRLQAAVSDVHVCVPADWDQCTRDSCRAGQPNMCIFIFEPYL